MTYSCCDFMDDIVEALGVSTGAGPEAAADEPSELADLCFDEIVRLQDLARNVGGLDMESLDRMSRETMRATILEYREQAQSILYGSPS